MLRFRKRSTGGRLAKVVIKTPPDYSPLEAARTGPTRRPLRPRSGPNLYRSLQSAKLCKFAMLYGRESKNPCRTRASPWILPGGFARTLLCRQQIPLRTKGPTRGGPMECRKLHRVQNPVPPHRETGARGLRISTSSFSKVVKEADLLG